MTTYTGNLILTPRRLADAMHKAIETKCNLLLGRIKRDNPEEAAWHDDTDLADIFGYRNERLGAHQVLRDKIAEQTYDGRTGYHIYLYLTREEAKLLEQALETRINITRGIFNRSPSYATRQDLTRSKGALDLLIIEQAKWPKTDNK